MLLHHDDHRCFIGTLTISRRIDTAPHHLARVVRRPNLVTPSATDQQRRHPIAINLDPAADGCGAVTLHCPQSGISERRPLRTRHLSTWRLTAETGDDEAGFNVRRVPAFALTIDLSPILQPGLAISTRATLSFHFVREPWWPHDMADALGVLADHWLRLLEELATA